MYYHTPMRIAYFLLACMPPLLTAVLLCSVASAEAPVRPRLVLTDAVERDWGIPELADWYGERIFEGIGWRLGTVSRGDGSVMKGGYTVIHPAKGKPFSWQHVYVLAAFDLLPDTILLVAVRDPELYWQDYDFSLGVEDAVELVWLDGDWEEQFAATLEFAPEGFPDGFVLAPDQRSLLAIKHPAAGEDELAEAGHELCLVSLRDGLISSVPLPGTEDLGGAPAAWWPVLMQWDGDALLVQTGEELRRYEVRWE
jgi:hypothetical protein